MCRWVDVLPARASDNREDIIVTKQKTGSLPAGLLALALGGFGIGLTEFGIVGLLPEIAADFAVTESVAGYLVSGYALAVAFGAIALTVTFSRVERKRVLLGLVMKTIPIPRERRANPFKTPDHWLKFYRVLFFQRSRFSRGLVKSLGNDVNVLVLLNHPLSPLRR